MKSAFTSGAWEALIYDELAAACAADRYARVIGRAEVLGTLGAARATVTSVSGLGAEAVALAVYTAYGVGAGWASISVLVAALAAPLLLLAAVIPRWLPAGTGKPARTDGRGDTAVDAEDSAPVRQAGQVGTGGVSAGGVSIGGG
jgi:hypothetical protein